MWNYRLGTAMMIIRGLNHFLMHQTLPNIYKKNAEKKKKLIPSNQSMLHLKITLRAEGTRKIANGRVISFMFLKKGCLKNQHLDVLHQF